MGRARLGVSGPLPARWEEEQDVDPQAQKRCPTPSPGRRLSSRRVASGVLELSGLLSPGSGDRGSVQVGLAEAQPCRGTAADGQSSAL